MSTITLSITKERTVECANNKSLFLTLVPHGGHENERRLINSVNCGRLMLCTYSYLADTFQGTQQTANNYKTSEVLASGSDGEHGAPEENVDTKVFGYREVLEETVGGELPDKDCNVD